MTDTSRYEGWLMSNYDIGSYTRGDMKGILERNAGFENMSNEAQTRILDNWTEFEGTVEVEVPQAFKDLPAPKSKETMSFWKKVVRLFGRRG